MSAYVQQSNGTLQSLRLRAGLSRRGLAKLAGVSDNTIRSAEEGERPPQPSTQLQIARALSEALGAPVDQFDLWPLLNHDGAPA